MEMVDFFFSFPEHMICLGLLIDFRAKTFTFISYNYKARGFEHRLPGYIAVFLLESGGSLCKFCASFPLCVFPGEFQSRMPSLHVLLWLLVINSCPLSSNHVKCSQSLP